MENLQSLFYGFEVVFTTQNLLAAFFGSIIGLFVGAMPGIGSLAGVALLLPLIFKFNPTTAIILLGALYFSNMYGGAYSAILINIPGDGPAIMSTLDGYPMAKKGKAGTALWTSNLSSFIGGGIGMVIVTFLGPALARIGLNFGPVEMASIMLVAMTSIGWLMGDDPLKGLISTCLGMLIACIGIDSVVGSPRFNFGTIQLMGGIPFTPLVIGLVGFSRVISMMQARGEKSPDIIKLKMTEGFPNAHELKLMFWPSVRAGFVGTFVGVLPGAGATAASFLCYAMQKAFKNETPMGSGSIEGLAATESANNAAASGAFAPLLALGIPGSGTGAVLLGGLMMWGLNPGPLLFQTNPDFAWGLIASLYVSNIVALVIGFLLIPLLSKAIRVRTGLMIPAITAVCIIGSYSTTNSMFGVWVMVISGIIGYIIEKFGYSANPTVLAIVLTNIFEVNLRRSFIISNGSPLIFFQKPISAAMMIILFGIVIASIVKPIIDKKRQKAKA